MNWIKRGFKHVIVISCVALLSGCAGPINTIKNSNSDLRTRYYEVSYDTVINGIVEVADSMENWKIEDVDEYQGLISIIDSNIWRNHFIKVKVDDLNGKKVRVNVRAVGDSAFSGPSVSEIEEFLEKIDKKFYR